ncbi:hypothetical protein [Runella sp.]|uniref:hypothetical protein n=1 Tax=Runella sp. TaxID=1960881 RepID=UPI003D0BFB52
MQKITSLIICLLFTIQLIAQNNGERTVIIKFKKHIDPNQNAEIGQIKNDFRIELIPLFEESDLRALAARVPLCRDAVDSLNRFYQIKGCVFDSRLLATLTAKFKNYVSRMDSYAVGTVTDGSITCNKNNSTGNITNTYITDMDLTGLDTGDSAGFSLIESSTYPVNPYINSKRTAMGSSIYIPLNVSRTRPTFNHSDKTLGVFWAAQSNPYCCTGCSNGIAPKGKLRTFFCTNDIDCNPSSSDSNFSISRALLRTLLLSQAGDILLFEFDDSNNIIESQPQIQELIQIATGCLGIIVIEPAGNGDRPINIATDSGAIVVGAAYKDGTNNYFIFPGTNYGNRVDVYSLTNFKSIVTKQGVCQRYSCTSGAAAVIAAMAVSFQSQYFKRKQKYLTPFQMRDLFRNNTGGSYKVASTGKYVAVGTLLVNAVNGMR